MATRIRVAAALAACALAASAGLALAQDRGGPPPRGQGGDRPPMQREAGRDPLASLLAMDQVQVEVVETDNGMKLNVTTERAEAVERLQQRVEQAVARMQQTAERAGERPQREGAPPATERGGRQAQGRPDMPGGKGLLVRLLNTGQLDVDTKKIDRGIAVRFSSENARIVSALHEQLPLMVLALQERRAGRPDEPRPEGMRRLIRLLGEEDVSIRVREKDKGVSVDVTSDNPELAKLIKDYLPDYFEQLQQMARRMKQAGESRRSRDAERDVPGRRDEGLPRGRRGGDGDQPSRAWVE